MPALFSEVSVFSMRKNPEITFSERLRRLVPVDASVSMVDWRHESAYNLVAKEVLDYPPKPSPSREGRHEQPSSVMLDASSVEGLKGTLRTFTSSKLTQNIFFHAELGEYSRPGEGTAQFRTRLAAKIDGMKKAKVSEIQTTYSSKMGAAKSQVKAVRDEYESIEKLVGGIKDELKALEKERSRADKEGRSTLKVSSQIQTREARLSRLQARITELGNKMGEYRREEEELEGEMKAETAKAGRELEALLDSPLQNIVFQPRMEEVDVGALQLVWVPVIEALFRASFEGATSDFKFEWNAVNGRGIFGTCAECGATIDSLEGGLFCCKCGDMYCQDHLKTCDACGRAVCSVHAWKCPQCGVVYCPDEKTVECTACGKRLCCKCAIRCATCGEGGGKVYCREHIKQCKICKNSYCPEHYSVHVAFCAKCGKELCTVEQVKCKTCGEVFCEADTVKCASCGGEVCRNDAWSCTKCGKEYCSEENKIKCATCGRTICTACVTYCTVCGSPLCADDIKVCPDCGGKICSSCLVETRRLGVFKKVVCKTCASK